MNILTRPIPVPPASQRGMSLLEVLIAVLILGIGVLGIAAMQASALRNSQSSMQQSEAVIAANSILDSMRSNPTGTYTLAAMTCVAPAPGATIASKDISNWITNMQTAISPGACGQITSDAAGVWTVVVRWNETADATAPTKTVTLASRIQ